jgi:hypothetical protein
MAESLRLTPKARLLFVITSLVFAAKERVGSRETKQKINAALRSARQDLERLGERERLTRKSRV